MSRNITELKQLQALPLAVKIQKTQQRLKEWVDTFGVDGVYISFSGGKDSTVLLHIARQMYPKIKAVFSDTGLEYQEIREFVKTFGNVDWVKPKMTFRQVIEEYGYPFISKEVSESAAGARRYLTEILAENSVDRQTDSTRIRISTEELRELANTQSLLRLSRGGADNKYRKLTGIGEYSQRTDGIQTGRKQLQICNHAGDADERQESSDKGEYP